MTQIGSEVSDGRDDRVLSDMSTTMAQLGQTSVSRRQFLGLILDNTAAVFFVLVHHQLLVLLISRVVVR